MSLAFGATDQNDHRQTCVPALDGLATASLSVVAPGSQGFAALNRSKEIFTGRLVSLERDRGKSLAKGRCAEPLPDA